MIFRILTYFSFACRLLAWKWLCVTVLLLLLASFTGVRAQQFAYVDTDYILEQVPAYRQAQQQLDAAARKWKEEIEKRKAALEKMRNDLEAEKVLLPKDIIEKRQQQIAQKEQALDAYKSEHFGREGALFQKRTELIKPVQDRVFEAIQKLAQDNALDVVFDKSGAVTMLYTNAKYDRSDEVLQLMGIKPPSEKRGKR